MGAKANIIVDQGTDFSTTITVTDDDGNVTDLTGYTAAGQIRKHYESSDSTAFTVSFGSPRSDGQVTLSLTRTVTANIEAGRYVYDVELSFVDDSGNSLVERLLEGSIYVKPSVTT